MHTVVFLNEVCVVSFEKYGNNKRTAIQLYVKETGEPMATASVNLPNETLADNEVAIKNYSENEGILQALIEAKIISTPKRYINGYQRFPICELLVEPK